MPNYYPKGGRCRACERRLDDQGNPVRTCVGHAKAMKQDATK
ncbi:hypothetical protein ACVG01_12245 [Pseudomonas aeruginosa]